MLFQEVAGWWVTYATHRSLVRSFMLITCKYTQAGMWPNHFGASSAKMPRLLFESTPRRIHQHHSHVILLRPNSWDDYSSSHFFKIEERSRLGWALCWAPLPYYLVLEWYVFFLFFQTTSILLSALIGQCPYALVIKYTEYYVCPSLIPTQVYIFFLILNLSNKVSQMAFCACLISNGFCSVNGEKFKHGIGVN